MSKEMHREKITSTNISSSVDVQENQIIGFNKSSSLNYSFRVYKDDKCGYYYYMGQISDEEGYKNAEKNLELNRPYPFEIEGGVRHRDKLETLPTDAELMNITKRCLSYLKKNFPDYTFAGAAATIIHTMKQENDVGMDYSTRDGHTSIQFEFKHKDSKDISDGYFTYNDRKFKMSKFKKIASGWLSSFNKMVEMPEECIIMDQYYGYTGKLKDALDVEKLKLGTSILTDKIGTKTFADNLTVFHDTSDKESWMNAFWDGDGTVPHKDKVYFIKNGKILRGYADKKTAKKYKVKPVPGSAYINYADIPGNGGINLSLKIENKTAKELLNGRLAIIPIQSSGGGFKEKGEYTMPVQIGLLTDGEKILGRVPPFTISTNMFDMFGKDYIGVAKRNELYNNKVLLFKAQKGNL